MIATKNVGRLLIQYPRYRRGSATALDLFVEHEVVKASGTSFVELSKWIGQNPASYGRRN